MKGGSIFFGEGSYTQGFQATLIGLWADISISGPNAIGAPNMVNIALKPNVT